MERYHIGAYAEPMAEHILAMALALAKQLLKNHNKLVQGEFNQFEINKMVSGSTVGIIGCGGLSPSAQARLRFKMDHPFCELPNFLGSPHNSAMVSGVIKRAFIENKPIRWAVSREQY